MPSEPNKGTLGSEIVPPMPNRADRRAAQRGGPNRGFYENDAFLSGRDALEDRKLKAELMKMMMQDHLRQVHAHLPKEELEELHFQWTSSEGEEGEFRGL